MALRYKTVWYGTASPAQASQTATISFPQIVIRHPENGKSLVAAVALYSSQPVISAGTNVTLTPHLFTRRGNSPVPDHTASVHLGTSVAVPTNTARSLTNVQIPLTAGIVSLSTTLTLNFSMRLQVSGTFAHNNFALVLGLTYKYDDTSARQTKTAILPVHPEVVSIPTTEARLGTIPKLQGAGGALPETSASVFHGFLSLLGSSYRQASTGTYQLHLRADGTASYSFSLQNPAATDYISQYLWPLEPYGLDQTAENVVYAYVTGTVNHVLFPQVLAFLTYDFELSAATRVLCHAEVPFMAATWHLSAGSTLVVPFSYAVPEGGTISLGRSAVLTTWSPNAAVNAQFSALAGDQSVDARTYSWSSASSSDYKTLHHPIDTSSSFSAAGLSLSYGEHYISNFYRVSNLSAYSNVNGVFHLNYIADTPSAGVGAATQVVYFPQGIGSFSATDSHAFEMTGLPESLSDYWIHAAFLLYGHQANTARSFWTYMLQLSATAADKAPPGYLAPSRAVRQMTIHALAEGAGGIAALRPDATVPLPHVRRHQFDPDPTRLDLHLGRTLRVLPLGSSAYEINSIDQLALVVCYHAVTHTADRVLTGYAGTGDAINVATYRADTGEKVWECSSSGAGLYRTRYYWRGYKLFDEARQDDSHVGRSNDYSF